MTYLKWLSEMAFPDKEQRICYQKLIFALFLTDFYWSVANDDNRAKNGIALRDMYEDETGLYSGKGNDPCSVLEMMLALAIDCEDKIMYDPDEGDRTSLWFAEMIFNLGLADMDDWSFNQEEFDEIMDIFLNRKYESDGYGGPFFIKGFNGDLRKIELWYQLNYYLKSRYLW